MPTFSVYLNLYKTEILIGLISLGVIALLAFYSLSVKEKRALRKLYMKPKK